MSAKTVAIVGATGIVGVKMCEIMKKYAPDRFEVVKFASSQTGDCYAVDDVLSLMPERAVFLTPDNVSEKYIPTLAKNHCLCIDNSAAFRLRRDVPLIVPDVNGNLLKLRRRIIANPNCTTIELCTVLGALRCLGLKHVVAATYQAASGAGKEGLADYVQRKAEGQTQSLPHTLSDNFFASIGEEDENGRTKEENKVINESRKILCYPKLDVSCCAVRVPVGVCHGIYANVEFEEKADLTKIKNLLEQSPSIRLDDCPMPIKAKDTPFVYVGRLNVEQNGKRLNCFIVADNLWRGAAYNAFEILCKSEDFYV